MNKASKILFSVFFWTVQLTWGSLTTIPGFLVFLVLAASGHKLHRNGCSLIVEVGGDWGGLELGAFAACGTYSKTYPSFYEHIRRHEFGHAIQQLLLGPFQIFVVFIPSVIRYWVFYFRAKKGLANPPYDSIWFEGTATKLGTKYVNLLEDSDYE